MAVLIEVKAPRGKLPCQWPPRQRAARTATGLGGYLRERGFMGVLLAGLAFDFCVLWSAEDARRQDFQVVVIEDACRALDVNGSAADARRRLQAAGAMLASSTDVESQAPA